MRLRVAPGPALSPAEVDACVALRGAVMRFKPDTDLAADSAAVRRAVTKADHVLLLADRAGELWAFITIRAFEPEGPAGMILYEAEYGYARPAARGHPMLAWLYVRLGAIVLSRGFGRERWLFGIGSYPTSYRTARRYVSVSGSSFDPRLPERVRAAIFAIAAERHGEGWDAERHLVRLRTLPAEMSAEFLSRVRGEPWWEEYERINPDWQEGWGVVCFTRVELRDVLRAAGGAVRRRLLRGGSAG